MRMKKCRGFKGTCHHSKRTQPVDNFNKRASAKDGYDYICRSCKKVANDSRTWDQLERNRILQRFKRNPKHNPRRNDEGKIFWKQKEAIKEQWYQLLDDLNIKTVSECNSEKDFMNLVAKEIRKKGYTIYKEFYIDSESRIDLGMPYDQIAIEVKLTKEASTHSDPHEQVKRYKKALPGWDIHLVSLDGSLGCTLKELLNQL